MAGCFNISWHWMLHSDYENAIWDTPSRPAKGRLSSNGTLGPMFTDSPLEYPVVSMLQPGWGPLLAQNTPSFTGGVVPRGKFMGGSGTKSRHIYYLMQAISLHKGLSVWDTTCLAALNISKVQSFVTLAAKHYLVPALLLCAA